MIETHKSNSLTALEQRKDNQGLLEKHRLTTRTKKIEMELHVIEVFNNNVQKAPAAEADREHSSEVFVTTWRFTKGPLAKTICLKPSVVFIFA